MSNGNNPSSANQNASIAVEPHQTFRLAYSTFKYQRMKLNPDNIRLFELTEQTRQVNVTFFFP